MLEKRAVILPRGGEKVFGLGDFWGQRRVGGEPKWFWKPHGPALINMTTGK